MRVGILTFHRAWNYGAVLQAYALQRSIESLGADCEIIDYRCKSLERTYGVFSVKDWTARGIASALAHIPSRAKSSARFRSFRADHLRCSESVYTSSNVVDATCEYEYLVVGSDQVWNPDITGGDETYFLDFCSDGSRKLSYAASIGKNPSIGAWDDLYLRHLGDFRAVSVREADSRDYLASLLNRKVQWVLDPVFLIPGGEWELLCAPMRIPRPYILVYCLHELSLYRYAVRMSELTGLGLVYIPQSVTTAVSGQRVVGPSVNEFLGYIRHAEFVVTDSFHVLAFSMIFRRNFRVQLKGQLEGLNSRVTSLLGSVGLERQILSPEDYLSHDLSVVDYGSASERIQSRVEESIDFLRVSLGLPVGH